MLLSNVYWFWTDQLLSSYQLTLDFDTCWYLHTSNTQFSFSSCKLALKGQGPWLCRLWCQGRRWNQRPSPCTENWKVSLFIFLSILFLISPFSSLSFCLALLFLFTIQQHYSPQIEMSSSENENKHKSYRLNYNYHYVIVIVIFLTHLSWISSSSLRGKCFECFYSIPKWKHWLFMIHKENIQWICLLWLSLM